MPHIFFISVWGFFYMSHHITHYISKSSNSLLGVAKSVTKTCYLSGFFAGIFLRSPAQAGASRIVISFFSRPILLNVSSMLIFVVGE